MSATRTEKWRKVSVHAWVGGTHTISLTGPNSDNVRSFVAYWSYYHKIQGWTTSRFSRSSLLNVLHNSGYNFKFHTNRYEVFILCIEYIIDGNRTTFWDVRRRAKGSTFEAGLDERCVELYLHLPQMFMLINQVNPVHISIYNTHFNIILAFTSTSLYLSKVPRFR